MTRVNCGVEPIMLTDRHLLAEHREIKRIPNLVSKGKYSMDNAPDEYKLGEGHVKFFYDKLGYLLKRYKEIYREYKRRGYKVEDYSSAWDGIPQEFMGDYKETAEDYAITMDRLLDKDEHYKEEIGLI